MRKSARGREHICACTQVCISLHPHTYIQEPHLSRHAHIIMKLNTCTRTRANAVIRRQKQYISTNIRKATYADMKTQVFDIAYVRSHPCLTMHAYVHLCKPTYAPTRRNAHTRKKNTYTHIHPKIQLRKHTPTHTRKCIHVYTQDRSVDTITCDYMHTCSNIWTRMGMCAYVACIR